MDKPSGLLPDWMIERDVKIVPFAPNQSRAGVISYGVTSYGYDVRLDTKFKVHERLGRSSIRRTSTPGRSSSRRRIMPHPAEQLRPRGDDEYIEIPRDVLVVRGQEHAGLGRLINVTPLNGSRVTLEISNTTPLPGVYANEGGPLLFFQPLQDQLRGQEGKYQDQPNLLPIDRDSDCVIRSYPDDDP